MHVPTSHPKPMHGLPRRPHLQHVVLTRQQVKTHYAQRPLLNQVAASHIYFFVSSNSLKGFITNMWRVERTNSSTVSRFNRPLGSIFTLVKESNICSIWAAKFIRCPSMHSFSKFAPRSKSRLPGYDDLRSFAIALVINRIINPVCSLYVNFSIEYFVQDSFHCPYVSSFWYTS